MLFVMSTFEEQAPDVSPAPTDQSDENGTVEIQRLLAWYFRDDPPRGPGARDLRDAA
jgi:hypothetical protein